MKRITFLIALLALSTGLVLTGCSDSDSDNNGTTDGGLTDASADAGPDVTEPTVVDVSYNFDDGKQGWSAGVTDYPNGAGGSINFVDQMRDLPEDMDITGKGYYLEGQNDPMDIFMFIKKQLGPDEGLQPQTSYRVDYTVSLATNYPDDCSEEQGQDMYLKLGGSKWEPASKLSSDQTYHEFNVDKGDDEVGGSAASAAGDITHDDECALVYNRYIPMSRQHSHTAAIETTDDGNLWLIVGVDSVFQGETSSYVTSVDVTLTPEAN
jgi:hypothetical protein